MGRTARFQLGQIVKVQRGKDSHQYAVVVGLLDERFVYIADGNKRKFDHWKRKNHTHLIACDFVSSEVANSLSTTGRVTNGKLRHALARYVEQSTSEAQDEQKGE